MNKDELDRIGCKTFVCFNLSYIDANCKAMKLSDKVIKRAKDISLAYLKKTYHNPSYSGVRPVLCGAICVASILEGEYITPNEMYYTSRNIAESNKRGNKRGCCSPVFTRKWCKTIVQKLGIDIGFVDGCPNTIRFKYGEEDKEVSFNRNSIDRNNYIDIYRSIYSLDILTNK